MTFNPKYLLKDILWMLLFIGGFFGLYILLDTVSSNYRFDCGLNNSVLELQTPFFKQYPILFKPAESVLVALAFLYPIIFYIIFYLLNRKKIPSKKNAFIAYSRSLLLLGLLLSVLGIQTYLMDLLYALVYIVILVLGVKFYIVLIGKPVAGKNPLAIFYFILCMLIFLFIYYIIIQAIAAAYAVNLNCRVMPRLF